MDDTFLRGKLGHFMVAITTHRVLSVQVAYLFGDYARAKELAEETLPGIGTAVGHVLQVEFLTYYSLTLTALHAEQSEEERAKSWAVISDTQQKLRDWAASCPENFRHTRS
jgi:hypothetical protein